MKIPLSWLKEFVAVPNKLSNGEIAAAFIKVGFEVEEIQEQGAKRPAAAGGAAEAQLGRRRRG
jgi:TRAP-type uncharacterized transport system substrate-binding protein